MKLQCSSRDIKRDIEINSEILIEKELFVNVLLQANNHREVQLLLKDFINKNKNHE